jgi:hypothetical protein
MGHNIREPLFSEQRGPRGAPSARRILGSDAWQDEEAEEEPPASAPRYVRYQDTTPREYIVRALSNDRVIQVPRQFARATPFPPTRDQPAPGAGLLRWSSYALLAVGLGGLGGVLLGGIVALVAAVRLMRFSEHARSWRRRSGGTGPRALPAAASAERLRLLGALGQAMLAALLGSALLLLLIWHFWQ